MALPTFDLMKKLNILFDLIYYDPWLKWQARLQKFIESLSRESPSIIKGVPGKSAPINCFYSGSCSNYSPCPHGVG